MGLCFRIVEGDRCRTAASFGFKQRQSAKYCEQHKDSAGAGVYTELVDPRRNHRCHSSDCRDPAIYAIPSGRRFCVQHKTHGTTNLAGVRCTAPGCQKWATHGPPLGNTVQLQRCRQHQHPNDQQRVITHTHKRCQHAGCDKHPAYDYPLPPNPKFASKLKRSYCAMHKLPGMIYTVTGPSSTALDRVTQGGMATQGTIKNGDCMFDMVRQVMNHLGQPQTISQLRNLGNNTAGRGNHIPLERYGTLHNLEDICTQQRLCCLLLRYDTKARAQYNPYVVCPSHQRQRPEAFFVGVLKEMRNESDNHFYLLRHGEALTWAAQDTLPAVVRQCWDFSGVPV